MYVRISLSIRRIDSPLGLIGWLTGARPPLRYRWRRGSGGIAFPPNPFAAYPSAVRRCGRAGASRARQRRLRAGPAPRSPGAAGR